jgi:zinc protease
VRLEAALDRDALSLTLESPAARAAEALDLFGLVALEPRFEDDEVEKARKEQVAAVQAIDDSSFDLVEREFYAALYEPSSIYGRPLEGTEAALATVTREDLLSWHRAAFSARFPVVALAGAIEAERALDLLDKALRRGPRAVPVAPPGERVTASGLLEGALPQLATPRAAPAREKLVKRKREQVAFRLGEVGIAASDPDFVPLSIAVRHLASDLFFRHVYEEGVAYRAWTYLRAGAGPHPFTFEMGVSAPNFRKVRASLEGALADLRERGLATGEVARAKREMIQRHVLAQRTDLALASMLARYETIGLGWEYADRFPALIEKTTVEEVNAAVRRHLDPQKLVIVAVGEF